MPSEFRPTRSGNNASAAALAASGARARAQRRNPTLTRGRGGAGPCPPPPAEPGPASARGIQPAAITVEHTAKERVEFAQGCVTVFFQRSFFPKVRGG